ncbi:MAG: hypothetical protein ACFNYD_03910, partial [Bacteroides sp.]
ASCSGFALRRNPNMKRRRYRVGTAKVRSRYLELIAATRFLFTFPLPYSTTILSTVLWLHHPYEA